MNKKLIITLSIVLTAVIVIAVTYICSKNTEQSENISGTPAPNMANPMVEVDGAKEINKQLAVNMTTPELAKNVRYFVIAGDLGEIRFDYRVSDFNEDVMDVSFRGSKVLAEDEIAGVYYSFDKIESLEKTYKRKTINYSTSYNTAEMLAVTGWSVDDINYSVFATGITDKDAYDRLVDKIMEETLK